MHGKLLLGAVLLPLGCGRLSLEPNTKHKFEILVKAATPQGQPVMGAQLLLENKPVGSTQADGTAIMKFVANEGETYDLVVQCPQGFQAPAKPIQVTLRKLADGKRPEFATTCAPSSQVLIVAVRAEGGPNLPVLYLNNEIGRTDEAGAAHVALRLAPEETFELKLGTTEPGNETLRPQNPTAIFTVKDRDEILHFDQKFTREVLRRPVYKKPPGPKPL
ncbi:MAG: hypothetical protein RMJ98_05105 [Myxococcales bacterium]|nr:hypothetical protein [Polyangiaceae bacterium]MDW8248667.1 hypothetical protein [Myxococcales bacterium]